MASRDASCSSLSSLPYLTVRSTRSDTGNAVEEEDGQDEKGMGEGRGVGVRPRRTGPAAARRSSEEEKKGRSCWCGCWIARDGGGGAAGGTPMASSCAGGSSMGRDMVIAAKLITCVGTQGQAVSNSSAAGHPSHTARCLQCTAFHASRRNKHAVQRCKAGPAYDGAGGRLL